MELPLPGSNLYVSMILIVMINKGKKLCNGITQLSLVAFFCFLIYVLSVCECLFTLSLLDACSNVS